MVTGKTVFNLFEYLFCLSQAAEIELVLYKLLIVDYVSLTSCGSSVEHRKRMRIICQRKKRRRGKSR